jgi:hypothetical protein
MINPRGQPYSDLARDVVRIPLSGKCLPLTGCTALSLTTPARHNASMKWCFSGRVGGEVGDSWRLLSRFCVH